MSLVSYLHDTPSCYLSWFVSWVLSWELFCCILPCVIILQHMKLGAQINSSFLYIVSVEYLVTLTTKEIQQTRKHMFLCLCTYVYEYINS